MNQKICINSHSSGNFREKIINGRNHIITPMLVIELDSVMNGLMYEGPEVRKALPQLENKLAPASHPNVSGHNVSAHHPLAINANHFGGFLGGSVINGDEVISDLIIDEIIASNSEQGVEVVRRIKAGERIGVSTGLNAKISNKAGKHSGKDFKGSVFDINFDHVAVLLNELPAGDNTFTLNSDVIFHDIENNTIPLTNTVGTRMSELKLDLSDLSAEDRAKYSQISVRDLVNAFENPISLDQAKEKVESEGYNIHNAKLDDVEEFLANADAFKAFKVKQLDEVEDTKKFIIKNSAMTTETLEGMGRDQLESIAKSVAPKNNFSLNSSSRVEVAETKLDLM